MKKLFFLFAVLILFSFKGKDSDCNNILTILSSPQFEKQFRFCDKKEDTITIYTDKRSGAFANISCEGLKLSCGKSVSFAVADFEIKIDETSRKVTNPRMVVWKENNEYHFFVTETNISCIASVKRGKVKDFSMGAF